MTTFTSVSRYVPGPTRTTVRARSVNRKGTTAMHGGGKSDGPIVPAKPPNKAGGAPPAAEGVEGRGPAKGNSVAGRQHRTQCRIELSTAGDGVRRVVRITRAPPPEARARCGSPARRDL